MQDLVQNHIINSATHKPHLFQLGLHLTLLTFTRLIRDAGTPPRCVWVPHVQFNESRTDHLQQPVNTQNTEGHVVPKSLLAACRLRSDG